MSALVGLNSKDQPTNICLLLLLTAFIMYIKQKQMFLKINWSSRCLVLFFNLATASLICVSGG